VNLVNIANNISLIAYILVNCYKIYTTIYIKTHLFLPYIINTLFIIRYNIINLQCYTLKPKF
jgi:hypothetical protein